MSLVTTDFCIYKCICVRHRINQVSLLNIHTEFRSILFNVEHFVSAKLLNETDKFRICDDYQLSSDSFFHDFVFAFYQQKALIRLVYTH